MHLPHVDMSDAGAPATAGDLVVRLQDALPEWPIEIRIAGYPVVHLNLDMEDVHFEEGKVILVIGSSGQVIHVEPVDYGEFEGGPFEEGEDDSG